LSRAALALLACVVAGGAAAQEPSVVPATGTLQAAFTPGDPADRMIIEAIGNARREVLVQAYTFTQRKIASALIRARQRGVTVRVVADAQQAANVPGSVLSALAKGGVEVFLDAAHEAAHNKVMVIDATGPDAAVITGSYNFTYSAQSRNAENLLLIRGNQALARAYREDWLRHREHATPLAHP
jgi:phosphatidylserine/phosphatidylglycerophosphate/cardiolipin synthase-like enzyme